MILSGKETYCLNLVVWRFRWSAGEFCLISRQVITKKRRLKWLMCSLVHRAESEHIWEVKGVTVDIVVNSIQLAYGDSILRYLALKSPATE